MIFLRQSTASQEVPLGRFVDSTDGNTEKTGLTIANTDIKIWKSGATTLANKNSGGATHIANGEYYCVLDATDTDTIGPLKVTVHVSGALYVQAFCTVLDEAVYDALFGTTALATATNITAGTITTATNVTTLNGIAANVITASALASDAVTEIRDAITGGAYALSTDANGRMRIVDGTGAGELDTSSGLVTLTAASVADINATLDTALADIRLDELLAADSDIDGAAPPTVGSVFHELMSATAGSFTFDQTTDSLEAIRNRGDAAWITATGFSTHSAADVWAVATRVLTAATNISGPIADQVWEETLADHSGTAGSTAEALNAAGAAGDPWTTALPGAYGAGSAGNIIGNYLTGNAYTRLGAPAGASIAADIAAVKSDTAAILLDTGTDGVVVNAAGLATDAVQEIRNAITGGAYALSTDALGMVRIVDGVGTGEIDTSTGGVNANRIGGVSQAGVDLGTILSSVTARIPTALDADGNILATVVSFNSGAAYLADEGATNLTVFFNDGLNTDGVKLGDLPLYSEVLNLHRLGLRKDAALATDLAALITTVNANLGTGGGTFANTTDALEAIRDRGDAAWITATGFSTLDAAGVRTAVGLASANLDTQLAAIVADTNELQTDWADGGRLDLILDARASQASVDIIDDYVDTEISTIISRIGVPAVSLASDIAALNDITAADVWAAATRTLTSGANIALAKGVGVTGFNDLSAAQVNAEVVDALATDTYAEQAQGAPAATASLATKLGWLYHSWRNLKTNDGTTTKLYDDAGTTVVAKQTTSEAAGTVSKAEWITGP